MIFYLVTASHAYTMEQFLQSWGARLASRIETVFYEHLETVPRFLSGTYIFSDLERLTPAQTELAAQVWYRLSQAGLRLLNHPRHTWRRYDLLRALYERGENRFQVYRLAEDCRPQRFPVFLRLERGHEVISPLLHTQAELDEAVLKRQRSDYRREELLVVEFCDTSDPHGMFRKYSSFVVADRIVPRHIFFSREWITRAPTSLDEDQLREEREYLLAAPHERWLRKVFRLAHVEYGRIDYSLVEGKPQVWEINTNPIVMLAPGDYPSELLPNQQLFARQVLPALEAIDLGTAAGRGFTLSTRVDRAFSG